MVSFYSNKTIGGWSSAGIIQDGDPGLPITCNSTHLTSFSVLVTTEAETAEVCVDAHNNNILTYFL